jgi:arylformamidase
MKILDISLPITSDLPVWPGDPGVMIRQTKSLQAGNPSNVSHLSLSVHSGTHLDAPSHFLENGATVDQLPLEVFMGPVYICFLPEVDRITSSELEKSHIPRDIKRLLFRTKNSELWAKGVTEFTRDYVALTPDAAQWLVDKNFELIGLDYLSVQLFHDPDPRTHIILLSAGLIVVEGLNLAKVRSGEYKLICLPLNIPGVEGAPVRALLLEE